MTLTSDTRNARRRQLAEATEDFAGYLSEVTDGDLGAPTPCPDWTIGTLYGHVLALTATAAGGQSVEPAATCTSGGFSELRETTFRHAARAAADVLVGAAEETYGRYLANLVIHTWDLAQGIGFDYEVPSNAVLGSTLRVVRGISAAERGAGRSFAQVPDFPTFSTLEEVLVLSGRLPTWHTT